MTQTYPPGIAHERMVKRRCPECGEKPGKHFKGALFWAEPEAIVTECTLRQDGVMDRIKAYRESL